MIEESDFTAVRDAMATFDLSPRIEPNQSIEPDRAFFPEGHRGVLDFKRQLVVGNRGMGKSFWTHAILNSDLRSRLAQAYRLPILEKTDGVIGFNGSDKISVTAPTIEEVTDAFRVHNDPDLMWRAVLIRVAVQHTTGDVAPPLSVVMKDIASQPGLYARRLTAADESLARQGRSLLIMFDALDRLSADWEGIRALTRALLVRVLGLQSFRNIRAKVFMRVDQFADPELFQFPDSSKILNDRVDLAWRPHELYGLLLFEIARRSTARPALERIAENSGTRRAIPEGGHINTAALDEQERLIPAIAGDFMGGHKKRGRVYSWVPLHLSDAANNCSPRTFLTAWKTAAEHVPPPQNRAVDHLGLIDGVRRASSNRLAELREDYPWIDSALEPLRRHFVPIPRDELFALWEQKGVVKRILENADRDRWLAPTGLFAERGPAAILQSMRSIAVMEERANGKINVPDIFRVEAEILRRGGVAVPRRD